MKIISYTASLIAVCSTTAVTGFSFQKPQSHVDNQSRDSVMERKSFLKKMVTAAVIPSISASLLSYPNAALAAPKDLPQLGTKAPYFDLPSSREKGANISLDQLAKTGKWTVLYFYPGAFTSGCTLEARGFQRDTDDYKNLNAQIVGVSVDAIEKNAQFCSEEKLDFTLLTDEGGKVSKAYGTALRIPGFGTFSNRQTYLIDPNGDIQWVFTDVESRVARHSAEVLEKLKELQA